MEAAALTLSGENAERFAERFVGSKANESRTSLNRRGVRNIHRYEGEGFTHSPTSGPPPTRTPGW